MPLHVSQDSVESYLKQLDSPRKEDIISLVAMMEKITECPPKLWGSIIGFGKLYYRYATGHDGYMPILGLANRKQAITLYLSFDIGKSKTLKSLGKYTIGKACLYIKRLKDIDLKVLHKLMKESFQESLHYDFVKRIE